MFTNVETIGYGYMVASGDNPHSIKSSQLYTISGIPVRSGTTHVREIVRMSLKLLDLSRPLKSDTGRKRNSS